jgi:hypothetical protein
MTARIFRTVDGGTIRNKLQVRLCCSPFSTKDYSETIALQYYVHPKAKKFAARPKRLDVVEELFFRHRAVKVAEESAAQVLTLCQPRNLSCSFPSRRISSPRSTHIFCLLSKDRIKVAKALTVPQALQDLDSPNLIAVYLTDAGAARPKHRALVTKLVAYTKNGGTVVAGGQFSNHVKPKEFEDFTKAWGLAWTFGSYHRTTFSLNPTNDIVKQNPSLSASYSMKSLHASQILPDTPFTSHRGFLSTVPCICTHEDRGKKRGPCRSNKSGSRLVRIHRRREWRRSIDEDSASNARVVGSSQ